jgi:hypothetical protein
MYYPADVCWDVLNDIMSSYYLHNHRIFGLNALQQEQECPEFMAFDHIQGLKASHKYKHNKIKDE